MANSRLLIILAISLALSACTVAPPIRVTSAPHSEAVVCGCTLRDYLIHFEWKDTSLSQDDRGYIASAATYYKQQTIKPDRIFVDGHEDTSEGLGEGQDISLKRAIIVEDQLIKSGVPASKIVLRAFGDRSPMIPTGPNVRNSVNRFAVISLE